MVQPFAAHGGPVASSQRSVSGARPYVGDLEIRVHGVSGTPPEELLGRGDVHQVAGDRLSGFYRPSLAEQLRDEPAADSPGAVTGPGPWLEGYSWGGWTSGARSRVLWLALLPFALVNVAGRMLPPEPADAPAARHLRLAAAALMRVLALSLTVTMVQGVAGVSMVTVALRCGATPGGPGACHGLPVFLTGLLGGLPVDARVLLCAAAPLAVLLLLWWVSRSASNRYEDFPDDPPAGRPDDAPQPLLRADLWRSGPVVSRLRLVHVQAGIASLAGTAGWLLADGTARMPRVVTLWLVAATLAIAVALVVRRPAPPYVAAARGRIMRPARLGWIAVAASLAGLAWQLADRAAADGAAGAGVTAGFADLAVRRADVLVQDLFVGQAALLAVVGVLVAAARLAGAGRGRAMFAGGFAGFLVAMLAWLSGAMLTASLLVIVPAWLARPGFAFTPRQIATALADPATAGWFGNTTRSSAVGTGVGVAVLVVLMLQALVRGLVAARTGGARRDRDAVLRDYPARAAADDPAVRARVRAIGTTFWWARRVDGVAGGMALLCAAIAGLLIAQGVALLAAPTAAGGWAAALLGRSAPRCVAVADTGLCAHVGLVAWGVFATAALAVLVLIAGVAAYRTRAARRGVGIFWDLACFWPRDTHPLAPPCYNERIMPQVSMRVAWYLGTGEAPVAAGHGDDGETPPGPALGRLVLAGHSQGSVIALAAALIQPEQTRGRLSLVTVGCVLDRLYARFYPRYFGPDIYRSAAGMLGGRADGRSGWINIWRHSDYLGGSVPYPPGDAGDGPDNVRSVDPEFAPPPGDTTVPAARRHSDFWTDPAFLPAVRALLRRAPRDVRAPAARR